jgi:uncharacterized RDD family membrane protein YckC
MEWYYVQGNDRVGPVSDEQLGQLVGQGAIAAQTLVWREGMPQWLPYQAVGVAAAGQAICSQCGRYFPPDDVLNYNGTLVCAECKPLFLQRLREGVAPVAAVSMAFAGFWRRFGAVFVDGIILYFVNFVVTLTLGLSAVSTGRRTSPGEGAFVLLLIVSYGIPIAYETIMIGRFGATLGKMALGVRVIVAGGGKVGYGRAFGRYFAKLLSSLILCIGYILAAFDKEKRALHDSICNTRVIMKQGV